ncbi:hypothetical protein [Thalassomonas haliotis]|uniref:Uncharacterized protein n=1 Tax=Thalassomonas haliotis TaxID=485448 RepID=A0ABY7VBD7_9GAMM|nr:hypothetical protein [Thalassomonas haliotis]WDE10620.1 hypothetical protein H3N35_20520 [Thalassomonas haliotis]
MPNQPKKPAPKGAKPNPAQFTNPAANIGMDAGEFDLKLALDKYSTAAVQLEAVSSLMDKFFLSQIMILPTPHEDPAVTEETRQLFDAAMERLIGWGRQLGEYIQRDVGKNPLNDEAKVEALRVKNFLDVFAETAGELARDILEPNDGNAATEGAIRAPFVHFPPVGHHHEHSFSNAVECGGCAVVIKEFRGLKLYRVKKIITRVIEPWTSRQRIINKEVWVLEWRHAQYIKTITVKCCCEHPVTEVSHTEVVDKGLSTFWRNY